jgi:polysaccharide biosynthesis protein PslE
MVTRTPNHATSTARDICRPLFRHRRKMVLLFCTTFGLVIAGLIFLPRTYSSDARVFVRLGKESVALDPTATVGPTVSMNESRESEINSEVEILRSQILLEDVVKELGADYILGNKPAGEPGWSEMLLTPLNVVKDVILQQGNISSEEYAVQRLKKTIVPSVPRKSNVIVVQCKTKQPEQAQRILATFLDAYLARHAKANRTSGSYEFFVDQSQLLRGQLEEATEQLRQAKNETGLVTIDGQRGNLQSQNDSIEAHMLETQRSLSAAEAKIATLQQSLETLPDRQLAEETEGLPNVAADFMRHELYKLQIAEKDASSRGTEAHPKVKALRRQVKEVQAILAEQDAGRIQATSKTNPTFKELEVTLLTQQSLAASLRAESEALTQQYADVTSKIRKLNDSEFHITELVRRTELLDSSYRNYVNNREQARIDQALESNQISNVNVLQPATFTAKASSPRVGLTLALGFVLAGLAALMAAVIAEYFDRSTKTPEQIEELLGVPVLLSVPRGTRHIFVRN